MFGQRKIALSGAKSSGKILFKTCNAGDGLNSAEQSRGSISPAQSN